MFGFLKKALSPFVKVSSALGQKIGSLFSGPLDETAYEELERVLYEADLGAELASELTEAARSVARKKGTLSSDQVVALVRERLLALFPPPPIPVLHTPHVILLVGVNGSGKTTTLAKLAQLYRSQGKKVLIAAGDTFRAAAIEQLTIWAQRIGAEIVTSQPNGDPAAVAFDAVQAALARKVDVVLIDTAGRLHNKTDLMRELEKMRRVIQKLLPEAPHETLLVLDATIGQNALDQAKTFHQFTPITGIALTKLDGTAKGGIAAALQKQLKIPIIWAGLGEGAEDLVPFDPVRYVDALLARS
jgi:fused signal recognition particle receptor